MGLLKAKDEGWLWQLARRGLPGSFSLDPATDPPQGPPPKSKPPKDGNNPPSTSSTSSISSTSNVPVSSMTTVATYTSITVVTSTSSFSTPSETTTLTTSSSSATSTLSVSSQTSSLTTTSSATFSGPPSTTSTTLTTFSYPGPTSTEGNRGLATVSTSQALATSTSTASPAADGISDTSNNSAGFFLGIGIAIGSSSAILLALIYFLYQRRRLHSQTRSTQSGNNILHDSNGSPQAPHWAGIFHSGNPKPSAVDVPPVTMAGNGYGGLGFTPGIFVPGTSNNREDETGAFHPDGLGRHPAFHSPSAVAENEFEVAELASPSVGPERMTVSTGILRLPDQEAAANSGNTRAVSAPTGAEALKFEIERGYERDLERQKMEKEWESARKRVTGGEPKASVASESEVSSLPRWRDPVTWVKGQRARIQKGRVRISG